MMATCAIANKDELQAGCFFVRLEKMFLLV